jgi:hypothetical protein
MCWGLFLFWDSCFAGMWLGPCTNELSWFAFQKEWQCLQQFN